LSAIRAGRALITRSSKLSIPQGLVRPERLGKFKNSPHRVLNPRPSGLQHSVLTITLPRASKCRFQITSRGSIMFDTKVAVTLKLKSCVSLHDNERCGGPNFSPTLAPLSSVTSRFLQPFPQTLLPDTQVFTKSNEGMSKYRDIDM
jgi:hypothetical protein